MSGYFIKISQFKNENSSRNVSGVLKMSYVSCGPMMVPLYIPLLTSSIDETCHSRVLSLNYCLCKIEIQSSLIICRLVAGYQNPPMLRMPYIKWRSTVSPPICGFPIRGFNPLRILQMQNPGYRRSTPIATPSPLS